MPFLDAKAQAVVKKELTELKDSVKLVVFTQEFECPHCRQNSNLAREVAELSDKLELELLDFVADKERAQGYNIDKIPAIVVEGAKDFGIRFFGVAAGYEFMSLIEAIKQVSSGESGLSLGSKQALALLEKPLHVQVFVTLTCPYCPGAVRLAHQLAVESELVRADMVEASEFPHLSHRYDVFAVPKTVVNETVSFEGALPEAQFLAEVMKATR